MPPPSGGTATGTGGGGPISLRGAIASADGRLILAPAGASVRTYAAPASAADGGGGGTASLVLVLAGHTDEVTSVCRDPQNDEQVYTTSLDGSLRTWHLPTASCVDVLELGCPIAAAVVPPPPPGAGGPGVAFLSLAWRGPDGGGGAGDGAGPSTPPSGRLVRVNLASRTVEPARFKSRAPLPLALAAGGSAVVAWERRTLWAWPAAPGSRLATPVTLHHTKAFTAAAVGGPADDVLAAGDASGRILVWRGLAGAVVGALQAAAGAPPTPPPGPAGSGTGGGTVAAGKARHPHPPSSPLPAPTTMHWHASAVQALAFTPDGAWLLSGGGEGVLVGWAAAGGGRSYLPRLGGPLTSIHPVPGLSGGSSVIVAQADNTLRRISLGPLAVEWSVHGLRPPLRAGGGLPAGGCAWRPGCPPLLAVAGANSGIQFFDPAADAHAFRLQASPRNPVAAAPLPGGAPPPPDPRVTGLAFSGDGQAMATAEASPRSGSPTGLASSLKLWCAPPATAAGGPPFILEAEVRDPHRGAVSAVAYSPASHAVASVGEDGELKVWVRRAAPPPSAAAAAAGAKAAPAASPLPGQWRCAWVASYRGLPMRDVAFSGDGTAVAAAAGGRAVVWSVAGGQRLAVLPSPPAGAGGPLVALAFVPGTPLLAGAYGGASPVACAWNLLDGRLAWAAGVSVIALAPSPAGGLLALALPPPGSAAPAAAGGRVVVLDAAAGPSAPPVFAWDVARGPVDALLWAGSAGRLCVLTSDREFALVGGEAGGDAASAAPSDLAPPTPAMAGYAAAFGGSDGGAGAAVVAARAAAGAGVASAAAKVAAVTPWSTLFDVPSHALPAPTALAGAFFDTLMAAEQ